MMYKLKNTILSGQLVIRTTDNACIPFDPANSDYQAYLLWISEGNSPIPAENE